MKGKARLSSVQESSRDIVWIAWAGTRAEVEKIFELAERLCADAKAADSKARMQWHDDAVEAAEAAWEKSSRDLATRRKELAERKKEAKADPSVSEYRLKGAESSVGFAEDDLKRRKRWWDDAITERKRELAAFNRDWKSNLTVVDRASKTTYAGTAEALVAKLDPRTFKTFVFVCAPGSYRIRQSIRLAADKDEIRLDIAGPSEDWTSSAWSQMVKEIQAGVPWWSWIRNRWTTLLWSVGWGVGASIALAGLNSPYWVSLIVAALGVGVAFGIQAIVRGVIRPFEVVDTGKKPRGAAAIGFLAALVVEVVIGVLINLWVK